MIIVFFLIGVSMVVALGFLLAYVWADKSGQFEDDYTPSVRILYDDQLKSTEICQQQPSKRSQSGKPD